MAWRCGKCEGLPVPEHHRSCSLRIAPIPRGRPIHVDASSAEAQERLVSMLSEEMAQGDTQRQLVYLQTKAGELHTALVTAEADLHSASEKLKRHALREQRYENAQCVDCGADLDVAAALHAAREELAIMLDRRCAKHPEAERLEGCADCVGEEIAKARRLQNAAEEELATLKAGLK